MTTVALIDYGSGNLRSAEKALLKAASSLSRAPTILVTGDPDAVAKADRIVLPGVGAFAACMGNLSARDGLIDALNTAVQRGAPFLGVCVGMQLLADSGLEFGTTPGLGWIPGQVRRLEPRDPAAKVPHMGWNTVRPASPLFAGLGFAPHMYFTHSFVFDPADPGDIAATCDHGGPFVAAVARDNVMGVQFHPEKSQAAGQRLLANFLELTL
ncbi:imidazole glycerol phosphate synthase subunit HisH [Caulobacter sp. NIBR1757]|uniref:imidazole glycerol phosphate synthase subunit HisH n=1 Tax=Caulobacter sp. NIBR1757 TaxID=3016000 RepID=UPI0022F12974|nr:imidazole glycerol phosphate synthase subunit HisH [Caulobacter sp. NIBR1757]WGM37252.1 Imidazole glycerol phosphate synthase subunit HisH [Caulobacter sp. NIBR1757]